MPRLPRMHFQHFMREVHARRRGLAGTDPLDRVAAELTREARGVPGRVHGVDIGDAMILLGARGPAPARRGAAADLQHPPQRLYEGGLQRARSCGDRAAHTPARCGGDRRRRRLSPAPAGRSEIYLDAAAPAVARMLDLFERLAGKAAVDRGGTMQVEERPIPTRRMRRHGVVRLHGPVRGPRSATTTSRWRASAHPVPLRRAVSSTVAMECRAALHRADRRAVRPARETGIAAAAPRGACIGEGGCWRLRTLRPVAHRDAQGRLNRLFSPGGCRCSPQQGAPLKTVARFAIDYEQLLDSAGRAAGLAAGLCR